VAAAKGETNTTVGNSKRTPRGEAADHAAFKGDGAYNGEFAGGSDSRTYGHHADEP